MIKSNKKFTNDEFLSTVEIKSIEKESLDRVFEQLTLLEKEESSDDDSQEKQYLKNIHEKAEKKKMKVDTNKKVKKEEKKIEVEEKEEQQHKFLNNKFGKKALRKILRPLINQNMKDEIDLMIWENDENLDKYIDYNEYEKMYKRCIEDKKEEESKKLYYLIQFLMYDKEKKGYIIEEDTLEILFIRYGPKFEDAITDIFAYYFYLVNLKISKLTKIDRTLRNN